MQPPCEGRREGDQKTSVGREGEGWEDEQDKRAWMPARTHRFKQAVCARVCNVRLVRCPHKTGRESGKTS